MFVRDFFFGQTEVRTVFRLAELNSFQLYSCYSSTTDGSDMDNDDGHSTVLVE